MDEYKSFVLSERDYISFPWYYGKTNYISHIYRIFTSNLPNCRCKGHAHNNKSYKICRIYCPISLVWGTVHKKSGFCSKEYYTQVILHKFASRNNEQTVTNTDNETVTSR